MMNIFMPPPVTPSERNRSPRAACTICECRLKPDLQKTKKPNRKTQIALPPLMTPLVEEPMAMSGW